MSAQLQLLPPAPAVADLLTIAQATRNSKRRACLETWGPGVRMVDHPARRLELLLAGVVLTTAARHAADVAPPAALDPAAWLRREARAWQTFAMQPRRKKLARHAENLGSAPNDVLSFDFERRTR